MQELTMEEIEGVSGTDCSESGATIEAVAAGVGLTAGIVALMPGGQPVAIGWGLAGLATAFVGATISAAGAHGYC